MSGSRRFLDNHGAAERWRIGVVLIISAALLFYVYVLNPAAKERERLREALPRMRATSVQMKEALKEVERLKSVLKQARSGGKGGSSLSAALFQSSAAENFYDIEIVPLGDDKAKVSSNGVAFKKIMGWVESLREKQGIRLDSCRLEVVEAPDIVEVSMTLIRP